MDKGTFNLCMERAFNLEEKDNLKALIDRMFYSNELVSVGSSTSTRDKANSQYISEVQTSPYKPVLWG